MRINNNLINCQNMTMKRSATVPDNKALLEAPLTDVSRLHEVTTPPTVSMTSRRLHPRLSSSEDILSAESTTECGDEDARLSPDDYVEDDEASGSGLDQPPPLRSVAVPDREAEEDDEKVRKHTLLSTLVMPRPQRKPPFTIEGAMSKLLRRNKSKKDEVIDQNNDNKPGAEDSKEKEAAVVVANGGHHKRRRKAHSPPPPPPPPLDETESGISSSVVDKHSLVTRLRGATGNGGHEVASSSGGDGRLLPSDEEATLPNFSDSDVAKKMKKVGKNDG